MRGDLIIILAGGLKEDGSLPSHVEQRLHKAFELGGENAVYVCSSAFTLNKPQVFKKGWVLSESAEMKKFLLKKNPQLKILLENASFDTIGSAVFTREFFNFVLKRKAITVITSDFHIARARTIFLKVFNLHPKVKYDTLEFVGVRSHRNSVARVEHEARSVKDFARKSDNWKTVDDCKAWLFSHHDNYADFGSSRPGERNMQEMFY